MSVSDDILQAIDTIVDKKIEKMNLDLTYSGIVSAVNSDGYTVEYNGTNINVKTTAIDLYKVGDMVKVCIPSGNKRRAYIVVDVEDISKLNGNFVAIDNKFNTDGKAKDSDMLDGVHAISFPRIYATHHGFQGASKWCLLGIVESGGDSYNVIIDYYGGNGFNGQSFQNSWFKIMIKDAWQPDASTTNNSFGVTVYRMNCPNVLVKVMAITSNKYMVYIYFPWSYSWGMYMIYGLYNSFTPIGSVSESEPVDGDPQDVGYYDY